MAGVELKSFTEPDGGTHTPMKQMDVVSTASGDVAYLTFQPGWVWTEHDKPVVQTELCPRPHFTYTIAGRLAVRMADGNEFVLGPGDVSVIPPGHDAWVVGDEPAVILDWGGTHAW